MIRKDSIKRVFILEDSEDLALLYRQWLSKIKEIRSYWAKDIEAGLKMASQIKPDLLIVDLKLSSDNSGLIFIEKLEKQQQSRIPAIIISGNLDKKSVKTSKDLGIVCAIKKPCYIEMFLRVIKNILWPNSKDLISYAYAEEIRDGSIKLISYDDETPIEFAVLNESEKDKYTVCLSSQAGCLMGCQFCKTGTTLNQNVFNLGCASMLAKVRSSEFFYGHKNLKKGIIFAGEGEPALNIREIRKLVEILKPEGFDFRLSTIGLLKKMPRLKRELGKHLSKLYLSVHFPREDQRRKYMPNADPARSILDFLEKNFSNIVEEIVLNFVIFKGINDSLNTGFEIVNLVKERPFTVQLSKAKPCGKFQPTDVTLEEAIFQIICESGINVRSFNSRGTGCGQMAAKIKNDD